MKKRLNCWEYMKCGRQPGGDKVKELGVCPATTEKKFDHVNEGAASGRFCWSVAGTYCKGRVQGTFAMKFEDCANCSFFKLVNEEEGREFVMLEKNIKKK